MNIREIEDKIKTLIEQKDIEALNSLYRNLLYNPQNPVFETVACIKKVVDMELTYRNHNND